MDARMSFFFLAETSQVIVFQCHITCAFNSLLIHSISLDWTNEKGRYGMEFQGNFRSCPVVLKRGILRMRNIQQHFSNFLLNENEQTIFILHSRIGVSLNCSRERRTRRRREEGNFWSIYVPWQPSISRSAHIGKRTWFTIHPLTIRKTAMANSGLTDQEQFIFGHVEPAMEDYLHASLDIYLAVQTRLRLLGT